jgi:drug/metabolite transporter (DMT)-like permease
VLTCVAGVRRLGSLRASFIGLLEVIVAISTAWLLLGEAPQVSQLLGGPLILLAVVLVQQDGFSSIDVD